MTRLTIQKAFDLAVQHHQAGRLPEAEQLYRRILAEQPGHLDATHFLGVINHQLGRHDVAVELIGRVIAARPDAAEAYSNLSAALKDTGDFDGAIAASRKAIELQPRYAEACGNLGNALLAAGRLEEAIVACRKAITLRGDFAEAWYNLGNALAGKEELEEAIAAYRRAIAIRPGYSEAHNNLGNALRAARRGDEAIAAYRRAVATGPDNAEAHNNLGIALKEGRHLDEAIAACRRAIALNPQMAGAYNNLGNALKEKGQIDEAVSAYQQAIGLRETYAEAHSNLGVALKDRGQLDEAIAAFRKAMALDPGFAEAHSNLGYTIYFHPAYDERAIVEEHRRWSERHVEPLRRFIQPHRNERSADRRLRIGYVSPDFREHPIGRFLLPLAAHHDHANFQVFFYSSVRAGDAYTREFQALADVWRDIRMLDDGAAANLIREDAIDILIDLTMLMANSRWRIFARKPAPLQLTYLAYHGITGMRTIDYRLSDPYIDPVASAADSVEFEKPLRLESSVWCYQSSLDEPVRDLPALEKGHVTFGCLNNLCKMSSGALAAWLEILAETAKARLVLNAPPGAARQRVREAAAARRIDPGRLEFVSIQPMREYLREYHRIDIALDPFPYPGGTTSCDALWMGVPVVTLRGDFPAGRGGASILSNVGLPRLIAETVPEYIRIASQLTADLPALRQLRRELRPKMEASPLMDAPRFAHSVEKALRKIWREYVGTKAT